MSRIAEIYKIDSNPVANPGAIVQGDKYRFTVLTPQMIRLEYNEEGIFEDRATQIVLNRNFPVPEFRVIDRKDSLEIITSNLHLIYDKKKFSRNGLSIEVRGNFSYYRSIWHFGEPFDNLKGTARTLDEANGEIPLDNGLLSRNGFSVIDDSKTLVIEDDGWVVPRNRECYDVYFLGYGREYLKCLKDFYRLCGETPMLPRFALGNWWSRFYPYSEEEYKDLIMKFNEEGIPFSVAVIDMDWHLRDIDPKYGSGWTGYTWNRDLFPDPEGFMDWLHKQGLHVTLNVHPADGVRAFEEMYTEMARELGVDYEKGDKIHFDITDPKFMQAYFKYLHHPHEEMGVDFWWIDWQQGTRTKIEGLDPLWMLNHFHFLDNRRKGKRALILSRYAGIGSHRYPVGFSGDSFATWESLDFQPYFTATASNVGFGWWSHDIGGHMHGTKSDDMAVRWVQFGVFSPIMRIHSSDNPFNVKEPWQYNLPAEKTMKEFLRLRHQLIPYLYTMNYRFNRHGEPFIQPMYYQYPEAEEAYQVPNQYFFGSELIVCPITKPTDQRLNMGFVKAWLPEGIYIDFFTGRIYEGGRKIRLFRDITTIPVLAKAGATIPMAAPGSIRNSTDNPESLEIRVFAGNDGMFTLYEDNSLNETLDNLREAFTKMEFRWGGTAEFTIDAVSGDHGVVPEKRDYIIKFVGFDDTDNIQVSSEDEKIPFKKQYDERTHTVELTLEKIDVHKKTTVKIGTNGRIARNNILKEVFDMLNRAQIEYDLKSEIYKHIRKYSHDRLKILASLEVLGLEDNLLGALFEIIAAS